MGFGNGWVFDRIEMIGLRIDALLRLTHPTLDGDRIIIRHEW